MTWYPQALRQRSEIAVLIAPLALTLTMSWGCSDPFNGKLPGDGGSGNGSCGNNEMDPGEECDDGNMDEGDGCTADCRVPACSDGVFDVGELCFDAPQVAYATAGGDTRSMVAIDCNGDEQIDIVTTNEGGNPALSVLRNVGDGLFAAPDVLSLSSAPTALAAGELNASSGVDLVVGFDNAYRLSTLAGMGPCIFAQPDDITTYLLAHTNHVVVGDFDGAMALDIAAFGEDPAVPDIGKIAVLLDGDSAATALVTDVTSGPVPMGAASADLDGNGLDDVVYTASTTDQLFVRLRINASAFASNPSKLATGVQPWAVALGDLDGDGSLDAVVANRAGASISVFLNDGNALFTTLPETTVEGGNVATTRPIDVALGDIDKDGDLDVITASNVDAAGTSWVTVLLNDGSGVLSFGGAFQVGPKPEALLVADFNNDGALDIATANAPNNPADSKVSVLLATP